MQLRERLAYAGVATGQRPPQPKELRPPAGFSRGENRYGAVHFRDQYFSADHRHGRVRLSGALHLDNALLERLGDSLHAGRIERAAFLDIETTGLSGGTGTYAFLVGVGSFEAFSFRVRQFFLADPSGEPAMLAAISETVDRCDSLVTFNGKSFDIPQLKTRFAMARMPAIMEDLPHIDLVHPSRRLFGRRLESCRLAEIEREILGLRRHDDVPGWQIPELYFAYIRRRDESRLHPVFEHNSLDVVSLAALIAHLNDIAGERPRPDAEHLLAVGKWDEARGRLTEASRLLGEAWRLDAETEHGGEAVRRFARLVRRTGDWEGCRAIWVEEVRRTPSVRRRLRAKIELAKLAEHRARDPLGALALAREAAGLLQSRADLARLLPNTSAALDHRIRRLERRAHVPLSGSGHYNRR